jgi:hypothetical protein
MYVEKYVIPVNKGSKNDYGEEIKKNQYLLIDFTKTIISANL